MKHWKALMLLSFLPSLASAQMCAPSTVSLSGSGATMAYTCTGDGNADVLTFDNQTTANATYNYVVTDDQGNILGLPPANMADFEGAPVGNCRVYGISYSGPLTGNLGDNIYLVDLAQQGCCILSSNYIEVIRDMPDGGNVLTTAGESMVYTCPGDGNADVIDFAVSNNSNSNSQYVVTDLNGIILGLPPANMVDFEGAPAGTCLVWHLSYTGNLTAAMGDDATMINFSDDCFDLSDDYVTVVREMPEGGNVLTAAGESIVYTCPGDGNADVIDFAVSGNSMSNSQYVVTDLNGIILGLPPANMVDFEGAPAGTCLVWHLSYTGNLTAAMGDDATMINFSDDCFDLSDDYVTIVREMPDGGNVTSLAGNTSETVIVGDGVADLIDFTVTGNSMSTSQWVVTDANGIILGLPPGNTVDFEGAPAGNCLVWHLSYTGNLTAMMGDDATMISFSDDCYDLSADYVEIIRLSTPAPNMVQTNTGSTSTTVNLASGQTVITFTNNASAGFNYQYAIADQSNNIVALPVGNTYDFAQLALGSYLVYGVQYLGNLTAQLGDNILTAQLSDQWATISSNAIVVDLSSSVGINELTDAIFQLYPNPAEDVLNINADFQIENIQVLDLQGRVVQESALGTESGLITINVGSLPVGTYMLFVSNDNGSRIERFVKR